MTRGILDVLTGYLGRPVLIWLHDSDTSLPGRLTAVHADGITLQSASPPQTFLIPVPSIKVAELHGPRVRA